MPLREQSRGSGAIAVFNFRADLSTRDLIILFGTFGQIFQVDTTNLPDPKSLLARVVLTTRDSIGVTTSLEPPKSVGDRRAAVIHFSEIEDAEMASKNMNGFVMGGDSLFVAMVKSANLKV